MKWEKSKNGVNSDFFIQKSPLRRFFDCKIPKNGVDLNNNIFTSMMESQMNSKNKKEVQEIIKTYKSLVLGIDKEAKVGAKERAYGGRIRSGKGKLVESIAEKIVRMAWKELDGGEDRLRIDRKKFKVPIKSSYIQRIKSREVKRYITDNIKKHYYSIGVDWHIYIDNKLVLAIECKSYTENAMLKRILVDFALLKNMHKDLNCVLFQFESQLGGDYSEMGKPEFGSASTHTLLSYFDVDLNIITLIKGERKVDSPIHKKEFFKPLTKEAIFNAFVTIKAILKEYIR